MLAALVWLSPGPTKAYEVPDVLLVAVNVLLVTEQVSVPELVRLPVGGASTVTDVVAVLVQAELELSELVVVTLKLYTPAARPLTVAVLVVLVVPIWPLGPLKVYVVIPDALVPGVAVKLIELPTQTAGALAVSMG